MQHPQQFVLPYENNSFEDMVHVKIRALFLVVILGTFLSSCSTQEYTVPMRYSFHLKAISKLPDAKKISRQEMMDWYNTNLSAYHFNPQWDNALQDMRNDCHVVEVPITVDGALFFTKINGQLTPYVCRWQDKNIHGHDFAGNVVAYSFITQKVTMSVYNRTGLVRSADKGLPTGYEGRFLAIFMADNFWKILASGVLTQNVIMQ